MHLYRTSYGAVVAFEGEMRGIRVAWDLLVNRVGLRSYLLDLLDRGIFEPEPPPFDLLPPIGHQEVWGAGVTYERSRVARREESENAGGGDFYDRVYTAERPELFFKALPHRVAGPNSPIFIRPDSDWNVPEPELALLISSEGTIEGYTIGNDVSSRSIEGANPLYLPQAKTYDRSCALGPSIWLPENLPAANTSIELSVERNTEVVFEGATSLSRMKRSFDELVSFLYRACSFPYGCFLLTGTGIVPPDAFSLQVGDLVNIRIDEIGTLQNQVEEAPSRP